MDRLPVELGALGFQAVVTSLLAIVYLRLWQRQHQAFFGTWALAWTLYVARLGLISLYIVSRLEFWLFLHQAVTGLTALLLLWAALQFSRGARWRWSYSWLGVAAVAWAFFAIVVVHSMMAAGITAALLLSGVTLWTGMVFWRYRQRVHSAGATVLAWAFTLWGFHHLDYPLLRPLGSGVLIGVFIDVLFIMVVALGTLFMVLSDGRRTLEQRTAQLEQLTQQLLRAQEDERRRISRELHDEAGQVLTAVKIELDLEGRREASAMVGRALAQVRDISNLLRPSELDDLGLVPAVRGLAEDFSKRTQVRVALEIDESLQSPSPEQQVVIYRVLQEALTNVARHARAKEVHVTLASNADQVVLRIEDDGQGFEHEPVPHLGLLGMRERVAALGGSLVIEGVPGAGVRLAISLPSAVGA